MHVCARVISGAHGEVELLFHHVDLFARGMDPVACLVVMAIRLEHGELAVRWLMIERTFVGVRVRWGGPVKGSRHGRFLVGLPYLSMTDGAGLLAACDAGHQHWG